MWALTINFLEASIAYHFSKKFKQKKTTKNVRKFYIYINIIYFTKISIPFKYYFKLNIIYSILAFVRFEQTTISRKPKNPGT